MIKPLIENLKKGAEKVSNNPQLIYTVLVAVLIVGSFIFVAERFTGIASDAQERLINVRIGSIQDAFVSFASDRIEDPEYLNRKIKDIVTTNETIRNFQIVVPKSQNTYEVIASSKSDDIGKEDTEPHFLFTLAGSDPMRSFTLSYSENGERLFKTARIILRPEGGIAGAVISTQTLSLADRAIEKKIAESRILLFFIILIIMLLFLRLSRVIDYIELYEKLKSVDQLKDDFISMASHELRTPLAVIRGYAEFIRKAPELSLETKTYSEKIDISAKDLDVLVADILDVSRIEQGRLEFNLLELDPKNVIEEVVSGFELPAREKGLELAVEAPPGLAIIADPERLRQVLLNLIGNAVKYTKKGGIKIRLYKEEESVRMRISDTGIGMTEEERSRLFEKFYRIRSDETKDIRGTGLGLWITKEIIKGMKGKISIESIKDVGSHFIITFPAVKK